MCENLEGKNDGIDYWRCNMVNKLFFREMADTKNHFLSLMSGSELQETEYAELLE